MTHTEEETKQQWQTEDCLETTLMSNLLRTSRPYPRTPYYQVQYNYFLEIQAKLEGNINKMKVSDEEPNGNWKILNRETSTIMTIRYRPTLMLSPIQKKKLSSNDKQKTAQKLLRCLIYREPANPTPRISSCQIQIC